MEEARVIHNGGLELRGVAMSVVGERVVAELNGLPCLPLEMVTPPRKGITVSRSFGEHLTDREGVKQALVQFAGRAGEKLRRERLMGQRLSVFLMTSPFSAVQPFYSNAMIRTLPFPTDYTPDLIEAAATILDRIFKRASPTRNAASCWLTSCRRRTTSNRAVHGSTPMASCINISC
jgi:nucleotidyltransferase/DNA polymerase involved in DNA repair